MTKMRMPLTLFLLLTLTLLLAACATANSNSADNAANNSTTNTGTDDIMPVPSVSAADQEIINGTVTIAEVVSEGPGWLVVHAQADGKPGPILGVSPVADGANPDVVVEINLENATETLYAMLHTDAGEIGTFEFPGGDDGPVAVDGNVITPAFMVSGLPAAEMTVPSVSAADQEIINGTVTIAEVVSEGPGWLVVHAQADGKPGPILGFSPVADGANPDVVVEINLENTTETLYAMLHTDAGEIGTFEFPEGDDGPVSVDGNVITPAFMVSGLSTAGTLVMVTESAALGSFLVDEDGMTLYLFLNDTPGTSSCYDTCAVTWPVLFTSGAPVAGEGINPSLLGTTTRTDGSLQVTYNGWPLYYYIGDSAPGDVTGQDVGSVWYVISPEGDVVNP